MPRGPACRPVVTFTLLAAAVVLLPPAPLFSAAINRCVGPGGEIRFTDRECPEGYRREGAAISPETRKADTDEPYICRFSGILSSFEMPSAVEEARNSLREARERKDREMTDYWEDCLERLEAREAKLGEGEAAPEAVPSTPPQKKTAVDPLCSRGSFDTESSGSLNFHVYFTNGADTSCEKVDYVCTYELIVLGPVLGTYTESQYLQYRGRLRPGTRVRLGSVSPRSGPPGRRLGWSRCRLRR